MQPYAPKTQNVDEYIALFPENIAQKLKELRKIILDNVPAETEEIISYAMPAYRYKGIMVYFGGYTKHIGLYFPPRKLFNHFKIELAKYKITKSAIRFDLDKPLPEELIVKMLKFRIQENIESEHLKKTIRPQKNR